MLGLDYKNQFEKDWVQAPSRMKGLDCTRLKGKSVGIVGSDFWVRAIGLSLSALSKSKSLDMKISFGEPADILIYAYVSADNASGDVIGSADNIGTITADAVCCAEHVVIISDMSAKKHVDDNIGDVLTYLKVGDVFCCDYQSEIADKISGDDHAGLKPVYISEVLCALAVIIANGLGGEFVVCHGSGDENDLLTKIKDEQIPVSDAIELTHAGRQAPDESFLFSDAKDPEFKTVQALVMGILCAVDKLCRDNGIKYFLGGGTLLGAVRHKGFIPWDYDGDIMMTRDQYDKFISAAKEQLPKQLFLQIPETDKDNHFYTKIRLNGTVFSTEFTSQFEHLHQGVFVDVFVHDKTASSAFGRKLHKNLTIFTRSLVFNKWGDTDIKGIEQDGSHKIVRKIATVIKNILPMSLLEKWQFKTIEHYKNKKNAQYLYDGMGQNIRKGAFPKIWLDEQVECEFEGQKFPIPKEYDKYLTWLYGDYMQTIDCSKRHISHEIIKTDLGKYSEFKMGDRFI